METKKGTLFPEGATHTDYCQGPGWKPRSGQGEGIHRVPWDKGTCGACGAPLVGRNRWFCPSTPTTYDKPGRSCRANYAVNHFWQEAAAYAVKRANYTCQRCGKHPGPPGEGLEVHHKRACEGKRAPSCLHHQDNLEVLCHDCHKGETAKQMKDVWARRREVNRVLREQQRERGRRGRRPRLRRSRRNRSNWRQVTHEKCTQSRWQTLRRSESHAAVAGMAFGAATVRRAGVQRDFPASPEESAVPQPALPVARVGPRAPEGEGGEDAMTDRLILEGEETGEHRRLEVRGDTAVVVDYLLAGPNSAQHKYRTKDVATLRPAQLRWALEQLGELPRQLSTPDRR